jgi:hypothetical protein
VNRDLHCIASHEQWLEETGEVELIGGWGEILLAADFSSRLLPATLMATCEDALHFDQARAALSRFVYLQHPAELQHVEGRLAGLQR